MGDDFSRDDPHVGPAHLPGADAGASVTIDDHGHVRGVDVTVPGTAESWIRCTGNQEVTIRLAETRAGCLIQPTLMRASHRRTSILPFQVG